MNEMEERGIVDRVLGVAVTASTKPDGNLYSSLSKACFTIRPFYVSVTNDKIIND